MGNLSKIKLSSKLLGNWCKNKFSSSLKEKLEGNLNCKGNKQALFWQQAKAGISPDVFHHPNNNQLLTQSPRPVIDLQRYEFLRLLDSPDPIVHKAPEAGLFHSGRNRGNRLTLKEKGRAEISRAARGSLQPEHSIA